LWKGPVRIADIMTEKNWIYRKGPLLHGAAVAQAEAAGLREEVLAVDPPAAQAEAGNLFIIGPFNSG
jgi:hypothetical protein